ncbi:hypothetical protein AAER26_07860, partial [Pseudomonas aeruginosa]
FYLAPGLNTALFYQQQDVLKMTTEEQGMLGFYGSIAAVICAFGYGVVCKRFDLRTLMVAGIAAGTVANLGYLFYT